MSVAPHESVNVSLFQAGAALNANSRWQEVIADNLASSSIPGYKKQQLSLAAVQAGLMPAGVNGSQSPQMFVIPKSTTTTNFTAGEMRSTSVPTDLAIEGKGFFQVQLPGGTTGYTRDGEFQVNAKGQLSTKEGYPVLGQGGPIKLDPADPAPVSISTSGDVTQGAVSKGKLAVTEFKKPELLTQISASYFVAQNQGLQTQPSTSKVRQGYLESSNSSTVLEMANLMTAMRGFEANQHVVQIQDDRMSKTISDLGNTA
jgi:flagellar basal-body rod protein FlgG